MASAPSTCRSSHSPLRGIATPVAVVIVTPAVAWYERAYADAAARARARLG
jgi:hypothetical protein